MLASTNETLMPHFVAIDPDQENMEEGGMTIDEAISCHLQITAPGEGVESRFPASIEVPPICALSGAAPLLSTEPK